MGFIRPALGRLAASLTKRRKPKALPAEVPASALLLNDFPLTLTGDYLTLEV